MIVSENWEKYKTREISQNVQFPLISMSHAFAYIILVLLNKKLGLKNTILLVVLLLESCWKIKIPNQMWNVPQILITKIHGKSRSDWIKHQETYDIAY